jgi:hypothetical protein
MEKEVQSNNAANGIIRQFIENGDAVVDDEGQVRLVTGARVIGNVPDDEM